MEQTVQISYLPKSKFQIICRLLGFDRTDILYIYNFSQRSTF